MNHERDNWKQEHKSAKYMSQLTCDLKKKNTVDYNIQMTVNDISAYYVQPLSKSFLINRTIKKT